MDRRIVLRVLAVGIPLSTIALIYFFPYGASLLFGTIFMLAPLWLPVVLVLALFPVWLVFIRSRYVHRVRYSTLELIPGDATPRTAKPMELIFYSLYYRTEISRSQALIKGFVRVPWSFEVYATAGTVRFFIHVPAVHRTAIEGRVRTEYRDIDITEADDYSRLHAIRPFTHRTVVREYALEKPDPYPLRTYLSHEHGKERRDVFEELLEELATVGDGEALWLSLMVRPHQRDWPDGIWGMRETPRDSLHDDAHTEIQKIIGPTGDIRHLPPAQLELVRSIEEALKKPSFDCGLRVAYVARVSNFNEVRAQSLDALFTRFGDPSRNGFRAYDPLDRVPWPLSDIFSVVPPLKSEYLIHLYRRRAFFAPPYYGTPFVLNTEELATVYHMPKVGRAGALGRSRGMHLQPPDNLPI